MDWTKGDVRKSQWKFQSQNWNESGEDNDEHCSLTNPRMKQNSTTVLACLLFVSPALAGRIEVCADLADIGGPAEDTIVECWDYDSLSSDDYMAGGRLDSTGCVSLDYATTSKSWWRCSSWWDACTDTKPDIYCRLGGPGDCIQPLTTEIQHSRSQDGLTDFGTITVAPDKEFCSDATWNGCGTDDIPVWLQEIASADFESSCIQHDVCYSSCSLTRSHCDGIFQENMYATCDGQFACEFLADLYYTAVDLAGRDPCSQAREESCSRSQTELCNL